MSVIKKTLQEVDAKARKQSQSRKSTREEVVAAVIAEAYGNALNVKETRSLILKAIRDEVLTANEVESLQRTAAEKLHLEELSREHQQRESRRLAAEQHLAETRERCKLELQEALGAVTEARQESHAAFSASRRLADLKLTHGELFD